MTNTPPQVLVTGWLPGPEDKGVTKNLGVVLEDPDGREVARRHESFTLPIDHSAHSLDKPLWYPVRLGDEPANTYGNYVFRIYLDGEFVTEVPFVITRDEASP